MNPRLNWHPVKTHPHGYWTGLSESIELRERNNPGLLPNLRHGSELVIASDYAGAGLAYQAISFIMLSVPGNDEWDKHRTHFRRQHLPDEREISYKRLRPTNHTAKALLPFLDAADCITGLLITFLLSRSIGNMISKYQRAEIQKTLPEFAGWKTHAYEMLFTVASLLGLLVAGLSAPDQNIWWLTDRDEIVANNQRILMTTRVFGAICKGFLSHNLGALRCGTEVFDQGTGHVKDLVSLTDLSSSALAEVWHWNAKDGVLPTGLQFVSSSEKIPPKARVIVGWLARKDKPLKKLVCVFDPATDRTGRHLNYYWPGFDVNEQREEYLAKS